MELSQHQRMDLVAFCEAINDVALVFPYSASQVAGDADIECTIASAGKNVDGRTLVQGSSFAI